MTVITGETLDLGPVDQLSYGEGRAFDVAGAQVAVFRLRDGSIKALSAVCTHRGGPIADGQIDQRVVLCPLHLRAFELDTGCSPSGAAPLRTWAVSLDAEDHMLISADPSLMKPSLSGPSSIAVGDG